MGYNELMQYHGHIDPVRADEYCLDRLDEADSKELERHILTCTQCQIAIRETNAYVQAMGAADAVRRHSRPQKDGFLIVFPGASRRP